MYMHIDRQHNHGATPLLFAFPFRFPFASLPFPFTYLETLLDVIGSCPPWSQAARKLISPFPSPPHSKIPTPWGFPELNMRLTKTTSRIQLTRSGTFGYFFANNMGINVYATTYTVQLGAVILTFFEKMENAKAEADVKFTPKTHLSKVLFLFFCYFGRI